MHTNNPFQAKPDHSHYIICSDRLANIKDYSHKRFFFTLYTSIAGIILSLITPSIFCLSAIKSTLFLTVLIILAWLGTSILKQPHMIAFALYGYAFVNSCMNFDKFNICFVTPLTILFSFAVSIYGMFLYSSAFIEFHDIRIISKTEGYPYFNERFTSQTENINYSSQYYRENYDDDDELPMNEISEVSPDFTNMPKQQQIIADVSQMEDIPLTPVEIPTRGCRKHNSEKNVVSVDSPKIPKKIDADVVSPSKDTEANKSTPDCNYAGAVTEINENTAYNNVYEPIEIKSNDIKSLQENSASAENNHTQQDKLLSAAEQLQKRLKAFGFTSDTQSVYSQLKQNNSSLSTDFEEKYGFYKINDTESENSSKDKGNST